jgi:hypothetical protein
MLLQQKLAHRRFLPCVLDGIDLDALRAYRIPHVGVVCYVSPDAQVLPAAHSATRGFYARAPQRIEKPPAAVFHEAFLERLMVPGRRRHLAAEAP